MKSSQIAALLSSVVGAVVLSVAFVTSSSSEPRAVDPAPAAHAGTKAVLFSPGGGLSEPPPSPGQRAPAANESDGGEDVRDDGRVDPAAVESSRPATLAELQDFRAYVVGTLSELREAEAAEKLRRLEERAVGLDEAMTDLEERLGLTAAQSDALRSALLMRYDRETEYVRLWEKGADPDILEELKASDREAHVDELSGFLGREQLTSFLRWEGGE